MNYEIVCLYIFKKYSLFVRFYLIFFKFLKVSVSRCLCVYI